MSITATNSVNNVQTSVNFKGGKTMPAEEFLMHLGVKIKPSGTKEEIIKQSIHNIIVDIKNGSIASKQALQELNKFMQCNKIDI